MGFLDSLIGEPPVPTQAEINAKRLTLVNEIEFKANQGTRNAVIGAILVVISIIMIACGESHETTGIFGIKYTEYSMALSCGSFILLVGAIMFFCGIRKRAKYKPSAEMIKAMDNDTFVAYMKNKDNSYNLSNLLGDSSSIITILQFISTL